MTLYKVQPANPRGDDDWFVYEAETAELALNLYVLDQAWFGCETEHSQIEETTYEELNAEYGPYVVAVVGYNEDFGPVYQDMKGTKVA